MGAYSAARGPLAGLGGERDRIEMERGGKGRRKGEGRERNVKEGANEKAWKGD